MNTVYPPDGHVCHEDTVLVLGHVGPDTPTLIIDSAPTGAMHTLTPSPEGFFAASVPLASGENHLTVRAEDVAGQPVGSYTLSVTRRPARPTPALSPLAVDVQTFTLATPCWMQPGDRLMLGVLASPGACVQVQIPGLLPEPLTLGPAQAVTPDGRWVDTRVNVFGALHWVGERLPAAAWYEGVLRIPAMSEPSAAGPQACVYPVSLRVSRSGPASGEMPLEIACPQTITVGGPLQAARVRPETEAVLRTAPSDQAARLTPQPAGTPLTVDAAMGSWRRVRLGQGRVGWTLDASLMMLPEPPQTNASPLRRMRVVAESPTAVCLTLEGPAPGPVEVVAQAQGLTLRLANTVMACDVLSQPARHAALRFLTWEQTGADELTLTLACPRLAGYTLWQAAHPRCLRVRSLPTRPGDCRIVIDPGHGGEESGAMGLDGVPEKDRNLAVALALREALQAQGFSHITLTRQNDHAVPLAERAAYASACEMLLSLHHNALPDGRDPMAHQGVGAYYYQPFSRALAAHLQQALVCSLGLVDDGLYEDSLALTRPSGAMAVLLELGYLTHPADCARIARADFAPRVAHTLARALAAYLEGASC